MSNFKFSLSGISTFVQQKMSTYSTLSTMDPNDVIREKMRTSKSTKNLQKYLEKRSAHSDTINTLCIVRPGMVLSGSRDKKIVLTNTDVGEVSLIWDGHQQEVTKLAYRNTIAKHTIISGCRDSSISMWLFNTTKSVRNFCGHRLVVTGLCYVSDDQFISGSRDSTVKLWDAETSSVIRTAERNRNLVTHIAANYPRRLIGQSSEDKTIKLWDTQHLDMIQQYPRKRHILTHCDFIDENSLVCCSNGFNNDGCEITIYDIRMNKAIKELRGHEGSVNCVAIVPVCEQKKMLVSVAADKTIRLWKLEDMSLVWTEESPFDADHFQCCAYPDGHIIVSGGNGRLAHYQAKIAAGRVVMDLQWTQCHSIPASTSNKTF